jgi:aryl-alcohol dehydrogenase-like predicted oxidoreductase
MRYKLLGKCGLRVSELCLGGMTFGEDWGSMLPGASKEEARKIFDLFVGKGGNFIDTANVYQNGTSEDIGVTVWSPLGGGVLSGKYNKQNTEEQKRFNVNNPMSASFVNERNISIATEVQAIAKEITKTPSQVALNWVRQQLKDKAVIIPIIGARTEAQIKDNLGCLDFELTSDQLKRLEEKSKIQLGFPHDFMSEAARVFLYGNTFSLIDNHRA